MWLSEHINSVDDNSYNEDDNSQWHNLTKDYGKYSPPHRIKNDDDDIIIYNAILA